LEKRRRKAVQLLQHEWTLEAVANSLKASTNSANRWPDAYEREGNHAHRSSITKQSRDAYFMES
jgi:hypothetical protein